MAHHWSNYMEDKIILPIYWTQEFKTKPDKTVLAGMNFYRNAHYHAQNSMKKDFHELVYSQFPAEVETHEGDFRLELGIYYKNASCDGANIAAIIEKFVLDSLQSMNVVINDNVKYHKGTTWKVLGQDKDDPRCEVTLVKEDTI